MTEPARAYLGLGLYGWLAGVVALWGQWPWSVCFVGAVAQDNSQDKALFTVRHVGRLAGECHVQAVNVIPAAQNVNVIPVRASFVSLDCAHLE